MITNDAGRQIVMTYEGLRLKAYKCPAGVWTIGYGHTGDVKPGTVITKHQAEEILEYDLGRFEDAVARLCPKANGNQFSACVAFTFNVGIKAFENSTLLKKFLAGAPLAAADEFKRWTHAGGKELPGLVKRRAAERALFLQVPS